MQAICCYETLVYLGTVRRGNPRQDHNVRWIYVVFACTPYFGRLESTPTSAPTSPKWSFSCKCSDWNLACMSHLPHTCCIFCFSHSPYLNRPNNRWLKIQVRSSTLHNLLVHVFPSFMSISCPQHPVLRSHKPIFFPYVKRPSITPVQNNVWNCCSLYCNLNVATGKGKQNILIHLLLVTDKCTKITYYSTTVLIIHIKTG
jgi:hypothetical protein